MGQFPTSDSIIGKALQVLPILDTAIDPRSAWLFENQSGTLGTNLNSSVLYVSEITGTPAATKADVAVILSGVEGVIGAVAAGGFKSFDPYTSSPSYNAFSNGAGYFTATGLLTSVTSSVPKSPAKQPSGLTVDITVAVPTSALVVGQGGTDYTVGNTFTSTAAPVGGTGLEGTIDTISGGLGTGPAATLIITRSGSGYSTGDVITITSAGSNNAAEFTITGALNGAITTIAVNAAGSNYSPGDIITVTQAGASGGTRAILRVVDSAPTIGDAVIFKNVPMGTILPVSVDYLMATGSTANLVCIAGK
tara:strand:+ start:1390 stop:2310 length:921 start_codon:yes stop_codon:yes gene_type:complete